MKKTDPSPIFSSASPGSFNYLKATVAHSLYRNGKVLIRRNTDGSDSGAKGIQLEPTQVCVHNARMLDNNTQCTLFKNGFELVSKPLDMDDVDFFNHASVTKNYYPGCARIVREVSSATFTAAFDHNVRSAGGKKEKRRIEGGQEVQGPAHIVHGDYTLTSAPQRLRDLTLVPKANDTLRELLPEGQALLDESIVEQTLNGGRFAIINVWRNIMPEPVATHPLALCDGQSVAVEDLVVFEIHYQDRVGENYFAKHSPAHQWFYYPAMTHDEALVIKQWDSDGVLASSGGEQADNSSPDKPCTFSFHRAFEDPATPDDAPDRWSIEVRCIALFD